MNTRTPTPEKATAARRREPLTRERIIEAALRVMDAEGLDAVTMRRIGRELGVEAMSLYNHVEDKDDILEGVTERVMNEFEFPASAGAWTEDALAMAREWRRLLGLHPSVCQLLAERHKPIDGLAAFRAMDAALGVLRRAGLSDREAAQAFNALGSYILGFVMMEQGLMLGTDEEHAQQHQQMAGALEGAGLPNVLACFPYFADCSTDEQFDFGLDLMIGGIRARAGARASVG
ncbi:MAG TPA: TetR/AcrR family transcriptional regulator [Actinomycetota bacterium]|nr:TetR/AcrR family transcriptional regulator [Actinomycetota bacterium]